ncbi:MAG: molybdopterin molybdotransferase MoeA, partial [bacterium]
LTVRGPITAGQFIRRAGSDLTAGSLALSAKEYLTPACIGVAAALGYATVRVYPLPRVGIFSSGDELVPVGTTPLPYQSFESNTWALNAACRQYAIRNATIVRTADDRAAIEAALDPLIAANDLVLITGGVSVGDHDHIKPALAALGAEIVFWRVRQRPGKPLLCAHRGTTLILGLPGNPVSTLTCFYLYATQAVHKMTQSSPWPLRQRTARLTAPVTGLADLTQFVRGWLRPDSDDQWIVTPQAQQGSHQLSALAHSNVLIELPEEARDYGEGDEVKCLRISR